MQRRVVPLVLSLACLGLAAGIAGAATVTSLGAQELGSVTQRIESSEQFKRAAARQSDSRLVLVGASRHEASGGNPEIVQVLYYKYEGGLTLRATLDAKKGTVMDVEALKAYPVPLAAEEQTEALRLAKELNGPVKALFAGARAGDLNVEVLTPVVADPADPRYGHRIVFLTLYRKSGSGPASMLEVDLTRRSVRSLVPEEGV